MSHAHDCMHVQNVANVTKCTFAQWGQTKDAAFVLYSLMLNALSKDVILLLRQQHH